MPKRVIDFDAMWASDKLASCAEWAQPEYAWFYGLADASGSFELTNLRVIWGRVAAVRRNLTLEQLTKIFEEFMTHGLLFTWEQNGKRYGHWTGSDVPGRLPPPSWRMRLERLAPPVPKDQLAQYLARYGARAPLTAAGNGTNARPSLDDSSTQDVTETPDESGMADSVQLEFKLGVDPPQAQEWDLNLDWKGRGNRAQVSSSSSLNADELQTNPPSRDETTEQMFAIYEAERGPLPPADVSSVEIRRQCVRRTAAGLKLEDFRQAVRRAAATPFLTGAGGRGWCATFYWFLANDDNIRKVLSGRYESPGEYVQTRRNEWNGRRESTSAVLSGAHTGAGPLPSAVGARVKAATLERIRAREELRLIVNDKEKAS